MSNRLFARRRGDRTPTLDLGSDIPNEEDKWDIRRDPRNARIISIFGRNSVFPEEVKQLIVRFMNQMTDALRTLVLREYESIRNIQRSILQVSGVLTHDDVELLDIGHENRQRRAYLLRRLDRIPRGLSTRRNAPWEEPARHMLPFAYGPGY